ncbi:killer cell lectin-like receptor subfamily B member 1B allele A [Symphorus nematophorus]
MQWVLFLIILMGQLFFFTCGEGTHAGQTSMTNKLTLIKESMTWEGALNYCRSHHDDLVSIPDSQQQERVQELAKNASTSFVWLGLRYTCTLDLWFWVNDKLVCYDNWAMNENTERCDMAAAMEKKTTHKWIKKADNDIFNFICICKF